MADYHRPFLKWAGNKYQIIGPIRARLPQGTRLVEPFVGSGALFLNTDYPAYLLCDANADLINLYQLLQSEGQAMIDACRALFVPEHNHADAYYELRARFNATTDRGEKAALFLYLNRHGYNGLCRYNAAGGFNVPFGRYAKPYFPATELAYFVARADRALFQQADFAATLRAAQPGDVIYCDPPYVPLSATANFTSYSADRFGQAEQLRLAELAEELRGRGIPVLISNHDTPFTRAAYARASITALTVRRMISRDATNRAHVGELLALFGAP